MAPALPVYTREEIERKFPEKFKSGNNEDIPDNCSLYELIQHQCTYDGNKVYCLPFKRVFLRCLENKGKEVIGYKLTPSHGNIKNIHNKLKIKDKFYRDIEITNKKNNLYLYNKEDDKIDKDIEQFLNADTILKDKMMEYYKNYK